MSVDRENQLSLPIFCCFFFYYLKDLGFPLLFEVTVWFKINLTPGWISIRDETWKCGKGIEAFCFFPCQNSGNNLSYGLLSLFLKYPGSNKTALASIENNIKSVMILMECLMRGYSIRTEIGLQEGNGRSMVADWDFTVIFLFQLLSGEGFIKILKHMKRIIHGNFSPWLKVMNYEGAVTCITKLSCGLSWVEINSISATKKSADECTECFLSLCKCIIRDMQKADCYLSCTAFVTSYLQSLISMYVPSHSNKIQWKRKQNY